MFLMRAAEEAILKHYSEDEMKTPMHMSMGEEGLVAGVCQALRDCDYALGTYRSHALYLGKTGETDHFFSELYGKKTGTAKGKAGSMHLSMPEKGLILCSAIVGATLSIANGLALSCKMKKEDRITAVFFGDGATDAGTFWESINYAAVEELPILFVHEDNNLAVHSKKKVRHGHNGIEEIIKKFNVEVLQDSCDDTLNIYEKALESIELIKFKKRPVFLNLNYFRYLEHVGINTDFNEEYRDKNCKDDWKNKDPIKIQRNKIANKEELEKLELLILNQIEDSILKAKKADFADENELYTDIYL